MPLTSILTRKALLLAKVEGIFRAEAVPSAVIKTEAGPIDSTSDIDAVEDEITITGHAFLNFDIIRPTIITSALPTGLAEDVDVVVVKIDANTIAVYSTLAGAAVEVADPTDETGRLILGTAVGTFSMSTTISDAVLVSEPDFPPDITSLERNNAKSHISPDPGIVARRVASMTFQREGRNNGIIDGTLAPILGRLLRGCGYAETQFGETGNEEETILDDAAIPINSPTGVFTYTKTVGYAGTLPRVVVIQCTTPGGTGVAAFTVFSPAVGSVQAEVNTTGVVMTDGGAFVLAQTASITIDASGITTDFDTGDTYVFTLAPAGHSYEPVSSGFESLTLYMYFDGLLHRMPGSRGTFTLEGEGANFANWTFTFTGDWVDPTDTAQPTTVNFEQTLPPSVELAALAVLGGKDFDATDPVEMQLCAQSFSVDAANNVVPRQCISDAESTAGAVITSRTPVGTFNPETVLEAQHAFWANLGNAERLYWALRIGRTQGNVTMVTAPYAQYSEIAYGDRDEIRIYEAGLRFTAPPDSQGNNELRFVLC